MDQPPADPKTGWILLEASIFPNQPCVDDLLGTFSAADSSLAVLDTSPSSNFRAPVSAANLSTAALGLLPLVLVLGEALFCGRKLTLEYR